VLAAIGEQPWWFQIFVGAYVGILLAFPFAILAILFIDYKVGKIASIKSAARSKTSASSLRVGYREGSFLISAAIARKAAAISLSFSIASLLRRDILQKVYTSALPDPRIVGRHLRPRPSARETQDSSARASSVGGHLEAEWPGGLCIDDQLVLGRPHHRQVGGLRASENPPSESPSPAVRIQLSGP
jgi:hypothetical protein